MKTITKQEYERQPRDYRGVLDGKPALVYLDEGSGKTVYGPVEITDDPGYIKVMHITTDGVNRLCGADSPWVAHIHYADSSFVDGIWCEACQEARKKIGAQDD